MDGAGGEFGGAGVDGLPFGVHDVVAVVVGLAVDGAGFDASAGHPDGVSAGMVVSAVVGAGERALAVDGSAELAGPDD